MAGCSPFPFELTEKISQLCKKMHNLLDTETPFIPEIEEILLAKANCFTALYDALLLKEPDFTQLTQAKATFEKWGFDTSILAVNSLDSIIRVINTRKNLEDIVDPVFKQLESLSALDGVLTQKFP